jgi:uncharacterized protein (UPF0332 family)
VEEEMGSPQSLLALARKTLSLKAKRLEDSTARRAISTAYYALFHLLTEAATGLFVSTAHPLAGVIRRTFNHPEMRVVSGMFSKGKLPKLFQESAPPVVSEELKFVAKTFVDLQLERESADYDPLHVVGLEQASQVVEKAEQAFATWTKVNTSDEARLYLACFLLHKTWNQDPRGVTQKRPETPEGNPT